MPSAFSSQKFRRRQVQLWERGGVEARLPLQPQPPRPALGVDSVSSTLRPDLESRGAKGQHLPPVIWWWPGEWQLPVAVKDWRLWDSVIPEVELPPNRPELVRCDGFAVRSQLAHVCLSQSGPG
eukprot:6070074-Amphidinium_carterae.1